jgi:ABC-type oligopeptide transport system ATPase subunit
MIDEQTIVTADLSQNYVETTVMKSVKSYKFDYSFTLDGHKYSGKIVLNGIPNTTKLNLYYLSSNPQIVSQDPYSELNSEQEKGSISDLIWGILWVIIAALICISLIRMFVQKKAAHTKEEEPIKEPVTETQQVQEEPKSEPQIDKEDPSRFMPH